MTSRSKNAVRTYEAEIEKNREESNWKKVADLAQQLKARSPLHESLAHFLIGEGKLEAYLNEWPPIKENIERAQRELSDSRGYLTLATDEIGKKAGVALDAFLLLGKLNYACGAYDDALKNYKLAELNNLTEKELPVRSLRIVAESYAIKGLCLEQTSVPSSTSRYKQAEKESEMIRSFEVSSELSLLYLQRAGGAGSNAGVLLETALQRAPLMHMRAGRLNDAIDRYREMLTAVESVATQGLRLTLARQLAEVLMRGVTGQVYRPPQNVPAPPQLQGTLTRRREEYVSEGPWKPKKYAGLNQFVPRNEYEEAILLLLVGEAMAVRDAVLSQSAEFEVARAHSLRNAVAVVDLLALLAARWGQHRLLLESLERAMKFSFGCAHIWRQRALATAAAARAPSLPLALAGLSALPAGAPPPGSTSWGASVRAMCVARRGATLLPRDAALRLVAAATCYRAAWIEEGLEFAQQALAIAEKEAEEEEDSEEGEAAIALLPRCYLYCGIGHQMTAQKSNSRPEKEAHSSQSFRLLTRAASLDSNDHLVFYHLALYYHQRGDFGDAMDATRTCLSVHAECGGALRLAAILFASPAAISITRLSHAHYPAAEWPLVNLARLQLKYGDVEGKGEGGDAALATGKELLRILHAADEGGSGGDVAYADLDALSDSQNDEGHSNRDAVSVRAESAGAFRVERALSAASSQSARARSPLAEPRAHAWLLLAELCLRLDRVSAAAGCVSEAAALTPYSHLVFYMRGQVHAASREWEEARQCYQNALAIHPTHLDSIVQLGATYYSLGWLRLAERALREAGALQPARADTWRRLALVLAALGEPAAAADAAAAALQLPAPSDHENLFST